MQPPLWCPHMQSTWSIDFCRGGSVHSVVTPYTHTRTEQVVERRLWFFLLTMECSYTGKNMGQTDLAEQRSLVLPQGVGVFHHTLQRFETQCMLLLLQIRRPPTGRGGGVYQLMAGGHNGSSVKRRAYATTQCRQWIHAVCSFFWRWSGHALERIWDRKS